MHINSNFEANFIRNLPYKPYCTNDLGCTFIHSKEQAVTKRYVQINPPHQIVYLVFDVDDPQAVMSWYDANLPPPSWTAQNPENGHAHIAYELKTPVFTTDASRQKIVRYLSAIQTGLAQKLGADMGYAQLLTKNPCHTDWRVKIWTEEKYELDYLADFVDLTIKAKRPQEALGLGRNCTLFETVRKWAYKAIRANLKRGYKYWYDQVLNMAQSVNGAFKSPLPYSEVRATAKSVAKWVWRNHNSTEFQKLFSKKQSIRAKAGVAKGNTSKGGQARSAQYSDMRQEALKLHLQGKTIKQISLLLKTHRNSISKWIKRGKFA